MENKNRKTEIALYIKRKKKKGIFGFSSNNKKENQK